MSMNLLFLDVETSGLNPLIHEIIEICMVETLPDGTIIRQFNSKIKPQYEVNPEAAKVNGYTPEKWVGAPPQHLVFAKINDIFGKCTCMPMDEWNPEDTAVVDSHHVEYCVAHPNNKLTPWGWNTPFDMSFIRPKLYFEMGYHVEDVRSLLRPFLPWDRKVKLESAVQLVLGKKLYEPGEPHSAVKDTMACVDLYKKVMKNWQDACR